MLGVVGTFFPRDDIKNECFFITWKIKRHQNSTVIYLKPPAPFITGIQDKIQRGVPETVESFLGAGLRFFLLTGDKQETSINIAHSIGLFNSSLPLLDLNIENFRDNSRALRKSMVPSRGEPVGAGEGDEEEVPVPENVCNQSSSTGVRSTGEGIKKPRKNPRFLLRRFTSDEIVHTMYHTLYKALRSGGGSELLARALATQARGGETRLAPSPSSGGELKSTEEQMKSLMAAAANAHLLFSNLKTLEASTAAAAPNIGGESVGGFSSGDVPRTVQLGTSAPGDEPLVGPEDAGGKTMRGNRDEGHGDREDGRRRSSGGGKISSVVPSQIGGAPCAAPGAAVEQLDGEGVVAHGARTLKDIAEVDLHGKHRREDEDDDEPQPTEKLLVDLPRILSQAPGPPQHPAWSSERRMSLMDLMLVAEEASKNHPRSPAASSGEAALVPIQDSDEREEDSSSQDTVSELFGFIKDVKQWGERREVVCGFTGKERGGVGEGGGDRLCGGEGGEWWRGEGVVERGGKGRETQGGGAAPVSQRRGNTKNTRLSSTRIGSTPRRRSQ